MRILELEINNIRGIKNVVLRPNGESLVVWGPNGSGKSAVVDAVDFLLTGSVSRLVGEGTAGISVREHGPHIDHKPGEAIVKASVVIPGHKSPIELARTMATPTRLVFPPEARDALQPVLEAASKGQHVLSRRQILGFVAAESGKRAAYVQSLLSLGDVEAIRKALVKAQSSAKADLRSSLSTQLSTESAIKTTLNIINISPELIRDAVNKQRSVLKGAALKLITSDNLKTDLGSPATSPEGQITNPKLLRQRFDKIVRLLTDGSIASVEQDLRTVISAAIRNQKDLDEIRKIKLYELGVDLIGEDGKCPLCGTVWPANDLRSHIEKHLDSARDISKKIKEIDDLCVKLKSPIEIITAFLKDLSSSIDKLKSKADKSVVLDWTASLRELSATLDSPLEKYPIDLSKDETENLLAPDNWETLLDDLLTKLDEEFPDIGPEQTAWDTLTQLKENLIQYNSSIKACRSATRFDELSKILIETYEEARDTVLSGLYENIENRFIELYKVIHAEDESEFKSSLRPDGAGLTLKVDFHSRGQFPPLALHSEGHQDTMGICLYLALAERLTEDLIDLTILDDVVMSVDSAHRRKICDLLKEKFPDRQFLITTHDRTWARELEISGVVKHSNSMEFSRWTIETGPLFITESDIWGKIEHDLVIGEVPSAAHQLRRGSEQFFEFVCDALQAKVRYRADGRYDLSDFAPGAISEYKKIFRKAKAAAQSWQHKGRTEKLEELETVAKQIIVRSNIEQWAINKNVHFTRWEEFHPNDFSPVVDAWRDLFGLFRCAECGAILKLLTDTQKEPVALRCGCGRVDLNLAAKKKLSPA